MCNRRNKRLPPNLTHQLELTFLGLQSALFQPLRFLPRWIKCHSCICRDIHSDFFASRKVVTRAGSPGYQETAMISYRKKNIRKKFCIVLMTVNVFVGRLYYSWWLTNDIKKGKLDSLQNFTHWLNVEPPTDISSHRLISFHMLYPQLNSRLKESKSQSFKNPSKSWFKIIFWLQFCM